MKKSACLAFLAVAGSAAFASTLYTAVDSKGQIKEIPVTNWQITTPGDGRLIANPSSLPLQVDIGVNKLSTSGILVTGCLPNETQPISVAAGSAIACVTTTNVNFASSDTTAVSGINIWGTYSVSNYSFAK